MLKTVIGALLFFFLIQPSLGQEPLLSHKWGQWKKWGDIGNGQYANPVIPADYSDIDCIRVGHEYFAVSSTFQYSPGLVIIHSKDLVNWETLGHAVSDLNQISPDMNWDKMNRYGKGIWAGAFRYYKNKFWIYFGTPDEGYFMTSAKSPAGPWEPLTHVLAEKGWDDCCPFLDDDGQLYLVGTNFADKYKIHLFKLTPDGKSVIKGTDKVIYQSDGSEANKLYKINGTYYHLFSEIKTDGRAIMMERSVKIDGPYSEKKQLSYAQREVNEPNQGGLIQTESGGWFFLTHHGTGDWEGRAVSLLPVNWVDGWPIIGKVGADKIGEMVWSGNMPVKRKSVFALQTDDDFSGDGIKPQWEWNYQPRADKWSLSERKGWLRLKAFKPLVFNDLTKAGNTLTQRVFRTANNIVSVKLDISGMANGQHAGLAHFGSPNYAALGVACNNNIKRLEFTIKGNSTNGPQLHGNIIWLKSQWGLDGKSRYYYSTDGKNFQSFADIYQLSWGAYRGDRIAIYSYNNTDDNGYIDIDFLHYKYTRK